MNCPRCGAPIQYGAAVCANCSLPLQWGGAAPQQAPVQPPPGYQGYQGYQQAPYPAQMYPQAPQAAGNSKLWLWIAVAGVVVVGIILAVVIGTSGSGKKTTPPAPAPTTFAPPTFAPPTTRPIPSISIPSISIPSLPSLSFDTSLVPSIPMPTAKAEATLIGAWTNVKADDDYQLVEFLPDGTFKVHRLDGSIQNGTYKITNGDYTSGNLQTTLNGNTEDSFFIASNSFLLWGSRMFFPYSG